jgi:hypothetical protein
MRLRNLVGPTLFLVSGLILAGCAEESLLEPSLRPTPSKSEPESALQCDDLTTEALIASALAASGREVVQPVEALQPSYAFDAALLGGSGGLSCSWRVGQGQMEIGADSGSWAYLSIQILNDAANLFVPPYKGDSPSEDQREIAGVNAYFSSGTEAGWVISAPIKDSWVLLTMKSSGLVTSDSWFQGTLPELVLEQMLPVAAQAFKTIQAATLNELSWPALSSRQGLASCDGGLAQVGIEQALGVLGGSSSYELFDLQEVKIDSFHDAVRARAGVFSCELFVEDMGVTNITVVRNYAPVLKRLVTSPDISQALEGVFLEGASGSESALLARGNVANRSPIFFNIGETLYRVYSESAVKVAEAIIAQSR